MKQATLLNLPAELLHIIFHQLESDHLLNIAKSCRQLNLVAIPVFMEREGIPDPQKSCVVTLSGRGYADEITAMNLDFSLVNIQEFFCILLSDLTWNIRRVTRLIRRLSSIGSVSLVIDSWDSRWSLHSDVVQKIIVAVLDLVETSISKACTSFQIVHYHPAPIDTGYQFEIVTDSMRPKMERLGRFFMKSLSLTRQDGPGQQGNGWRYRQLSQFKPIPRSISPISLHSTLTKLDLSSDFLLIPPFSTWTFAVMKSSPINSLSLRLPNLITEGEFQNYLFPRIVTSLPKLREIKLALLGIEFLTTITESLSLLPLLRTITLGLSFRVLPSTSLPTTYFGLPHLISFTGSPDQAAYLFGRAGFSCPNLEFVNIIVDTHFYPDFDHMSLENHLAILNTRFRDIGIEPCISVCLANDGRHPNASDMTKNSELDHLFTVSRLTLELPSVFGNNLTEADVANHALAWLDLFHNLKGLTLLNRRREAVPSTRAPELNHAAILSAINAKYPAITTFNLVELPSKYHYHWSNARDAWQRATDCIPTTTNFDHKSLEPTVCSHF